MKKSVFAILALSALVATPALADNSGKFYGALDLGSASLTNSNPGGTSFANPGVFSLGGGYIYNQNLSVEVAYKMLGDSTLTAGAASATAKNSALTAAAVGSYPLNDMFEVFGKLGVSMNTNQLSTAGFINNYNTTTTSTGLMYGIGATYKVSTQLGIRAQYENLGDFTYTNGVSRQNWKVGTSLVTIGATYSF